MPLIVNPEEGNGRDYHGLGCTSGLLMEEKKGGEIGFRTCALMIVVQAGRGRAWGRSKCQSGIGTPGPWRRATRPQRCSRVMYCLYASCTLNSHNNYCRNHHCVVVQTTSSLPIDGPLTLVQALQQILKTRRTQLDELVSPRWYRKERDL